MPRERSCSVYFLSPFLQALATIFQEHTAGEAARDGDELTCIWRRSKSTHRTQYNGLYEMCSDSSQESAGGMPLSEEVQWSV